MNEPKIYVLPNPEPQTAKFVRLEDAQEHVKHAEAQAIGFAWAFLCNEVSEGRDLMEITCPEVWEAWQNTDRVVSGDD